MSDPAAILARLRLASYLRSEQAAEDYCNELVDGGGRPLHLDRVLSMSALPESEADVVHEPQLTLFSEGDPYEVR